LRCNVLNVSATTFLASSGGGLGSFAEGVSKKSPLCKIISGFRLLSVIISSTNLFQTL